MRRIHYYTGCGVRVFGVSVPPNMTIYTEGVTCERCKKKLRKIHSAKTSTGDDDERRDEQQD